MANFLIIRKKLKIGRIHSPNFMWGVTLKASLFVRQIVPVHFLVILAMVFLLAPSGSMPSWAKVSSSPAQRSAIPPIPDYERARYGLIGVQIENIKEAEFANGNGILKGGIRITEFSFPQSPGQMAGLKVGDVIIRLNGERSTGMDNFLKSLRQFAPGKTVTLELWRDGVILQKPVILADMVKSVWRSANRGNLASMFMVGEWFWYGQNFAKSQKAAAKWYKRGAYGGDIDAMLSYSWVLEYGKGIPMDAFEGMKWLNRAAQAGSGAAWNRLARLSDPDREKGPNILMAIRNYRKAAELGHTTSMYELGRIFMAGSRVKKDAEQSFYYTGMGALRGDKNAMHNMASLYSQGFGVGKDQKKIARLLLEAIRLGNEFTLKQLAKSSRVWSKSSRREIQKLMKEAGLYKGAIDGGIGRASMRALRKAKGRTESWLLDIPPTLKPLEKKSFTHATFTKKERRRADRVVGLYYQHVQQACRVGRCEQSKFLADQAIDLATDLFGAKSADVGILSMNLAHVYSAFSHNAYAEVLYKRALSVRRAQFQPTDAKIGSSLRYLANIIRNQGNSAEAVGLYRESISIFAKNPGRRNKFHATLTKSDLVVALNHSGQSEEAYKLGKEVFETLKTEFPEDGSSLRTSLNNIAAAAVRLGKLDEGFEIHTNLIRIEHEKLKKYNPGTFEHNDLMRSLSISLNNLGDTEHQRGRLKEAGQAYATSMSYLERLSHKAKSTPFWGFVNTNRAMLSVRKKDWVQATDMLRKSVAISIKSSQEDDGAKFHRGVALDRSSGPARSTFNALIKTSYRLGLQKPTNMIDLGKEAFVWAQWTGLNRSAHAISQMSRRSLSSDPRTAALERMRQDTLKKWRTLDKKRIAFETMKISPKQRKKAQARLIVQLDDMTSEIEIIEAEMTKLRPREIFLVKNKPLSVSQVQNHLREDEALVFITMNHKVDNLPEETFIWAVTKTDSQWVKSDWGNKKFDQKVQDLRAGLDAFAAKKRGFSSSILTDKGQGLPFDLAASHALYEQLLGPFESLIGDKKHLMIVPANSLTALPFQVLVTKKPDIALPDYKGYSQADWLIRKHALTVLPSVEALGALRRDKPAQVSKVAAGKTPYIGFGNPLLLGPNGNDRSAWAYKNCPITDAFDQTAQIDRAPVDIASLFRGGRGITDVIRQQYPLPETAMELCTVAKLSKAKRGSVYLGARATEAQVKQLSQNGVLKNARVVHFATHGLLAVETGKILKNKAEPALLLTPPAQASKDDDGLLTASEVATLKLNADWVIMSACNTAGGDNIGAEALSGLARAFFYAGAKSLLVSHWYVNSNATVALITSAFNALEDDRKMGHSQAMRHAMLELLEKGDENAHPSNWAPFVVVGEGGEQ